MNRLFEQADRAYRAGSPHEALDKTTEIYRALQNLPGFPFFPAGVRKADHLLERLGKDLRSQLLPQPPQRPLQGDLILATLVYLDGGHTAVIKDLAETLPERPLALWLTLAHGKGGKVSPAALRRTGMADRSRMFDEADLWRCATMIVAELSDLRPARLFLLHHPDDCVAVVVAAAAAAMGSNICLLHHADSRPSCGLFLHGAEIFDFTPRACVFTRSILGLPSAWLPLTCPDPEAPAHTFLARGRLVTALSGGSKKVSEMKSPAYPELVAAVLDASGGHHVHIGPLDRATKRRVLGALRSKGLPGERVRWVDSAPTLIDALVEHEVDLMINTYPRGGARTAVETMAAGRAMTWHSPSADLDTLNGQMRYPGAPIWRNLKDLIDMIERTDQPWLEEQGSAARTWYRAVHHPRHWADALANFAAARQRPLPEGFDPGQVMHALLDQILETSQAGTAAKKFRLKHILPF